MKRTSWSDSDLIAAIVRVMGFVFVVATLWACAQTARVVVGHYVK